MKAYLLDTNHLGLAVDSESIVAQRMLEVRQAGARLGTCLPVLCEIQAGIQHVDRKLRYRRNLNKLLKQLRLWPIDLETTRIYGDIFNEVRQRGRVLSQIDMIIAAIARQRKLRVVTTDRDFEALPDIRTEDWSKP